MSRLPLLIGVSGKRMFDDSNAANDKAIADALRATFHRIFTKLDREYRHTPKILLIGAAFGTDLIAAQAVLDIQKTGNTGWGVIALLPFQRDEFRKDFEPGPKHLKDLEWLERFAQHQADFEALMKIADEDEGHHAIAPRVIARELPPLLAGPAQGEPQAETPTLEKRKQEPNPFRDAHYEQVGQFIAESAMIMIAVTKPDEAADSALATGGTNRIVAYRRAGHDRVGAAVADKSRILRRTRREPIAPPARFVWLIDPSSSANECGGYPVIPLPPLLTHATAKNYEGATNTPPEKEREHHFRTSLLLVERLDGFNEKLEEPDDLIADISRIAPEGLTIVLQQVTELISGLQVSINRQSRLAFKAMAVLFVAAVFTFEIFAKFYTEKPWVLAGYLLLLLVIVVIVDIGQRRFWQADAEDYRAVAEMLRVQRAWWSAGLDERVDHEHLQGASNDLVPVRYAGTAVIAWLLMRSDWRKPTQPDWSAVRDRGRPPGRFPLLHGRPRRWLLRKSSALLDTLRGRTRRGPSDWIGDQLNYFASKAPLREDAVGITEAASWTLFAASGFIGAILFALLLKLQIRGHELYGLLRSVSIGPDEYLVRWTSHPLSAAGWVLLALIVLCVRIEMRGLRRRKAIALSLVVGIAIALLLTLALISAAPGIGSLLEHPVEAETVADHGMIVLLVGLSAIAGAWRYLTERLNIEAEAHEYRDAHVRFDRAEHLLAAEPDENRARAIVFELGRLALAENEAWLKSRRERPLTPVVG
jgi:hypothetical protein